MYAYRAAMHRKSPRLVEAKELRTIYEAIIAQAGAFVKALTYKARHRRQINWDGTMHESQQLLWAVITGLMLAYFLFASMTM